MGGPSPLPLLSNNTWIWLGWEGFSRIRPEPHVIQGMCIYNLMLFGCKMQLPARMEMILIRIVAQKKGGFERHTVPFLQSEIPHNYFQAPRMEQDKHTIGHLPARVECCPARHFQPAGSGSINSTHFLVPQMMVCYDWFLHTSEELVMGFQYNV